MAEFWTIQSVNSHQKILPLSPTDTNLVTVTNLIKQFGRFAALRGVSADFSAGKLYAVLGDNGAGKTTLLRMLAGLTEPTQGEISILGRSVIWRTRRYCTTR
jgi:ABC-type multidrug transport system ATPase subunit